MKVRSSVFASFILISEVIGIALFLRGFFPVPVKSSLSSKSKLSDLPAEPLTGELSIVWLSDLPAFICDYLPALLTEKLMKYLL